MSVSRGCGDEEQPVVLRGGRESSELSNSKPSRSTKEQRIYLKCWKVHISLRIDFIELSPWCRRGKMDEIFSG